MTTVLAKLEGVEQLKKRLQAMERKSRKEIMQKMADSGAPVIADPANRDAPGPHVIYKITKKTTSSMEVSIGPDEEHWYYRFSEFGAQAHDINAKKKKNLVFTGNQGLVVIKKVKHPGIVARPFLRKNFDENREKALSEMKDTFWQGLRQECEEK